ncbi:hypothetical protein D3C85_1457430 [compost metagenome]
MPALDHPALQLHQLALETEEFAEIVPPRGFCRAVRNAVIEEFVEILGVFGQLQFEFLIAVVDQLAMDTLDQGVVGENHVWPRGVLSRRC